MQAEAQAGVRPRVRAEAEAGVEAQAGVRARVRAEAEAEAQAAPPVAAAAIVSATGL